LAHPPALLRVLAGARPLREPGRCRARAARWTLRSPSGPLRSCDLSGW